MMDDPEFTWFLDSCAPFEVARISKNCWGAFCESSCLFQSTRKGESDAWARRMEVTRADYQTEMRRKAVAAWAQIEAARAARLSRRAAADAARAAQMSFGF